MNKIKKLGVLAAVTVGLGGGALAMSAGPAEAAQMTPSTVCTYVREGQLQQRPCTFTEWWYLRFYA